MKLRGQGFILAPCRYDEFDQRELIKSFLTDALNQLRVDTDPKEFSISCLVKFLCVAPLIKDKGFKEECEWRLIAPLPVQPPIGLSFRSGKSMLIPYIKFPLPIPPDAAPYVEKTVLPIKKVIIGPSPHSLLDCIAVTQLQQSTKSPFPARGHASLLGIGRFFHVVCFTVRRGAGSVFKTWRPDLYPGNWTK